MLEVRNTQGKLKRGTVRSDGSVFWCYRTKEHTAECWVSAEAYVIKISKERERDRRNSADVEYKKAKRSAGLLKIEKAKIANGVRKHGDTCPVTGRKFWGYNVGVGEVWVTPEKFETTKRRGKDWERELPADHPRKLRWKLDERFKDLCRASARRRSKTAEARKQAAAKMRRMRQRPTVGIAVCCRSRLLSFLKSRGIRKHQRTEKLVGCSWAFLRDYLESQFKPGMSWDNRGEWHIDHIVPLSSAKTEVEVATLCHYTNLQPLWGFENIRKGAKVLHAASPCDAAKIPKPTSQP